MLYGSSTESNGNRSRLRRCIAATESPCPVTPMKRTRPSSRASIAASRAPPRRRACASSRDLCSRTARWRSRARRLEHGVDQPGEAALELIPPQREVLASSLLALGDDSGRGEGLEVMARGRLRHGNLDLAAVQLAGPPARGELADDLEPHGIRERLQHGEPVDVIEGGSIGGREMF